MRAWIRVVTILVALVTVAWALPALAGTTPITLGTAANYGVLVGANDTLSVNGFALNGNLGVGQNSTINQNGYANYVTGNAYLGGTENYTGGGVTWVSGSVVTQSMAQAISDASSASASAAALAATAGLTDQGGSINLNGGSVTIKALTNMSENVLDISALSLNNGTITFDDNGYTGAKFIINVTGNFNINSSGLGKSIIQGINGASASDIIFNIVNTGQSVSILGNSTNQIIGTILAPQANVQLGGGGTLTGEIIAGFNNAGKNYTVQSSSGGFDINSYGYVPRSGGGKVPEPSSIALFGAGIVAIAALARRYRPRLTEF
jgi:hypothetical protein